MSLHSDESNWQTFKRLWTYIRLYKAGLVVSTIALVINAAADTYMISLLKPLLDEGFGNAESNFLRILPFMILGSYVCAWFKWICLFLLFELGVRQCGDADASPSV